MNDLKEIKQVFVTYGLHLAFVREMEKASASRIKLTPHDWFQLVSTVLHDGPQLMLKCNFREEAKILEQQEKAKGMKYGGWTCSILQILKN